MKSITKAALAALFMAGLAAPAFAEDEEVVVTFESVLDTKDRKGRGLETDIKLVFANDKGNKTSGSPDSAKGFKLGRARDKKEACRLALLQALMKFQNKARLSHKTSVTNIKTAATDAFWSGDRNKCLCLGGGSNVRTTVTGNFND